MRLCERSEAISLAWVPLSRGLPRRCRSSQRQASLILSSSRAQRGNLLIYNQQARDCRVATAPLGPVGHAMTN